MKTLYLESVGGIAGDMFTASFLNAGIVDLREMNNILEILKLPDVRIQASETRRRGVPCTYLEVHIDSNQWKNRFHFRADGQLRMYEMIEYLNGLTLESQTLQLAREILLIHASARQGKPYSSSGVAASLAREAQERNQDSTAASGSSNAASDSGTAGTSEEMVGKGAAPGLDSSHDNPGLNPDQSITGAKNPASLQDNFDPQDPALQSLYDAGEVVDLLVDAVFAAHCVRRSEATSFYASPVRSGGGLHGDERHPVHPTAELFRGLPVINLKASLDEALRELSTPTGLSILRAVDPSFLPTWPEGRVRFMGVGGGAFDSDQFANLFRVVLLDKTTDPGLYSASRREPEGYTTIQYDVRCGLSPTKPEKMAGILDDLEKHGASDVRLYQRKDPSGKPSLGLAFICNDDDLTALSDHLLTNTTAFGIRYEKIRPGMPRPASSSRPATGGPPVAPSGGMGGMSSTDDNPYS